MCGFSMIKPRRLWNQALSFLFITATLVRAAEFVPAPSAEIPAPPREFRGVWVTTVFNLDWPSKPGLPVAQQQKELTDLMDKAVALNLNAIVR